MISSAIKESNPNCAECFASLRLYGDSLNPEEITRLLQMNPSDAAVKGEDSKSSSGKSRQAPTGRWILGTDGKLTSTNLEKHIEWILDRLASTGIKIDDLPGVERADIFGYWASASGHGGPGFSSELMGRLAEAHLPLGLDIYFS
jgi:hypothetical protein